MSVYPGLTESFVLSRVSHPWLGEGKENPVFRYGIGWSNYVECHNPNVDLEKYKEFCFYYEINGFPYVDTVEVTIR